MFEKTQHFCAEILPEELEVGVGGGEKAGGEEGWRRENCYFN